MGGDLQLEAALQPALLNTPLPATGCPAKVGPPASRLAIAVHGNRSLRGLDDPDQVPLREFSGASDATALRNVPILGQGQILSGANLAYVAN